MKKVYYFTMWLNDIVVSTEKPNFHYHEESVPFFFMFNTDMRYTKVIAHSKKEAIDKVKESLDENIRQTIDCCDLYGVNMPKCVYDDYLNTDVRAMPYYIAPNREYIIKKDAITSDGWSLEAYPDEVYLVHNICVNNSRNIEVDSLPATPENIKKYYLHSDLKEYPKYLIRRYKNVKDAYENAKRIYECLENSLDDGDKILIELNKDK